MKNKVVLITGGTGSFGQAFVKRALLESPSKLIVFSRDELKQFEMQKDLGNGIDSNSRIRFFIGDIRDKDRLKRAFRGVDIVIHAAALKQVPALEYNPMEAIKTNIFGAENIIEAAFECGVEKVLGISTDKAVNPINLYGATKLCMEKLFLSANAYSGYSTAFSIVRYGNVINSRGSVIPLFKELAKAGRPLPVTDKEMTRFFLTLEQGVDFVVKCLERMQGGEIFVPKVKSFKILDLAYLLATNGISIIGRRAGEKIHEILISEEESFRTLDAGDVFVINGTCKNEKSFSYSSETMNDSNLCLKSLL